MLYFFIFAFVVYGVDSRVEKYQFSVDCLNLKCKREGKVCGIKAEAGGFRLRLFLDECDLLDYKCAINDNFGYDVTDMEYCSQAFRAEPQIKPSPLDPCEVFDCLHPADDVPVCGTREDGKGFRIRIFQNKCRLWEYSCKNHVNFTITHLYICKGLDLPATTKKDKLQFSITNIPNLSSIDKNYQLIASDMLHQNNIVGENALNKPEIGEDNANKNVDPSQIQNIDPNHRKVENTSIDNEFYIAAEHIDINYVNSNSENYTTAADYNEESVRLNSDNNDTNPKLGPNIDIEPEIMKDEPKIDNLNINYDKFKKIIVVRGQLRDKNRVNETIQNFFSATHVFNLPIEEMPENYLNESTRRTLIKSAGPIKVFIPKFEFPKNTTNIHLDKPTLHSCFHRCPTKCPATYAPVCGVPGRLAREPSLMFLNHCFMDVAQCKQYYENKSPTSLSSAYQEMPFVFCLGDAMSNMYHFLPLVKTLQHMGRLPKKARFHYRISNLKIFNHLMLIKNPNLMG